MNALKTFFPLSWKFAKDVANLIIGIIVYLIVGAIVGALITLSVMITGWLPLIGPIIAWALGIVSSLIGIYTLIGIIIMFLVFFKVLK